MSEPREDILPVLESIRAAAGEVCLPAVPISGVDQITVPAEVCEWIRSVGSELERLQGSDREGGLRLQQFERLLKQSEHRQKADQEKIAKLETDLNASQESISNLVSEKSKYEIEMREMRREFERVEADGAMVKGRLDRCEVEKMELSRVVERKQGEMESLNEQVEALLSRQSQLRQDLMGKEGELAEARRSLSTARIELSGAEQQNQSAKKQAEWATSELERTLTELRDYRKEKMEEISTLRSGMEAAQIGVLSLEKQLGTAKSLLEEKDCKIEEILAELLQTREELAEREKSFITEMDAKTMMVKVCEGAAAEASSRVTELEGQLEESQRTILSLEEKLAAESAEHEKGEEQLRALVEEKEALIASLRSEGKIDEISTSASAAMMTIKSGQTFSQVYSELSQARSGLLEARQENERLKGCLRDICEDIEARLPGIQAEREENSRLKSTVTSLSERLLIVCQERDKCKDSGERVEKENKSLVNEVKALERQVSDLGLQIQTLLGQSEMVDSSGSIVTAQDVITDRLVPIHNVAELQQRNAELLRVVRDLASRAEVAEAELEKIRNGSSSSPIDGGLLEKAMAEIAELKEAREQQAALVQTIVQQQQKNTEHQTSDNRHVDLTMEEPSLPLFGKEEKDALERKLSEAKEEYLSAKSQLAKANARAEFLQERLELLKANWESSRAELEQSRTSQAEQSRVLSKAQSELQGMLADVLSAREAARRAEVELANVRATLTSSQTTERRLVMEREELQEEKQRLASLLSGLQAMVSESEAASMTVRERLTEQISFLEKELQDTRRRLEETLEAQRLETAALQRENRELYERMTSVYAEASAAASKRMVDNVQTVTAVESADGMAELRLLCQAHEASLMQVSQSYDEYKTDAAARISELDGELKRISGEKENLLQQLEEVKAEHFQETAAMQARLSQLSELETVLQENAGLRASDLIRLNELLGEAQSQLEVERARASEASEKLSNLEAELRNSQLESDRLTSVLSATENRLKEREAELNGKLSAVEGELERARADLEKILSASSASGPETAGDLSSFIRRQKDAAVLELSAVQQDNRRLQAQLDQTTALLGEARARLEEAMGANDWQAQMMSEYEALQQKVTTLSQLGEANAELAEQIRSLQSRLTATEQAKHAVEGQLEMASGQLREIRAAEQTHAEHVRVLIADRDAWRSRAISEGKQLVEETPDASSIEELARLREENEKFAERQVALEAKVKRILQQCTLFKSQADEARKKATGLEEEMAVLAQTSSASNPPAVNVDALTLQVQELEKERETLKTTVTRFQLALQKMSTIRQSYNQSQSELEALKLQHQQLLQQQQQQGASAQSIDDLKREHEMHKTLLISQWQGRVNRLQAQIDTLQAAQQAPPAEPVLSDEVPAAKRPRPEPSVRDVEMTSAVEEQPMAMQTDNPTDQIEEVEMEHEEVGEEEEEEEEYAHDTDGVYDDVEEEEGEEGEEHFEDHLDNGEDLEDYVEEEDEEVRGKDMDTAAEAVQSPPLATAPKETPSLVAEAVSSPPLTEEFDIDQFLIEQDLQPTKAATVTAPPKIISLSPTRRPAPIPSVTPVIPTTNVTASSTVPVAAPLKTLNLPVSTGSTNTTAPSAPVPRSRIIDLSQTGRKPIPIPTTLSSQPASAATPATTQQPAKPKHKMLKRKFIKRGGGPAPGNA